MRSVFLFTLLLTFSIVLVLVGLTFSDAFATMRMPEPFVDNNPVLYAHDLPRSEPVFTADDMPATQPSINIPKEQNLGVVTAYYLNFRSEPSANGIILDSFQNGIILTVLDQEGDWYQVETEDGRVGWVDGEYLLVDGSVIDLNPIKGFTPEERLAYCARIHCWVSNDPRNT